MGKAKPIFADDEDRRLDAESGRILRDLRLDAGISQKSLAISLGVSNSYLCELERGTRILRVSVWNKALDIINRELAKQEQ